MYRQTYLACSRRQYLVQRVKAPFEFVRRLPFPRCGETDGLLDHRKDEHAKSSRERQQGWDRTVLRPGGPCRRQPGYRREQRDRDVVGRRLRENPAESLRRAWNRQGRESLHRGRGLYWEVLPHGTRTPAEVAELADALASGASGRKAIGVRVPASALSLAHARSCAKAVLRRSTVGAWRLGLRARVPASAPTFARFASFGWQANGSSTEARSAKVDWQVRLPRRRSRLRTIVSIVRVSTVLSALCSLSCGGSASGPSAVGIAGNWSGTYTDATFNRTGPATASFTQSNQAVSGQIVLSSEPPAPSLRINITGTMSGNALTATVMVPICGSGGGHASGELDNGMLRISLPTVEGSACTFVLDGTLVLRRA